MNRLLHVWLTIMLMAIITIANAQQPLLKTAPIPDNTTPSLRADGFLLTHWTQEYP